MENNVVRVVLWGEEVGKLYWDDKSQRAVFNYARSFVRKGLDIAPLTASVRGAASKGMPVLGDKGKLYQGLPPFLADSLPDRWGNLLFDRWAEQNGIPRRRLTSVDKLSFIGTRGMGALEFEPAVPDLAMDAELQIGSLYRLAQEILEDKERLSVRDDETFRLRHLYEVGTSAGGKHPKAVVAINEQTRDIRSGQVPLPDGYTYYILKFAESDDFPFTQVEMAYYDMAREAGITIMPSRLIQVEGKSHFLTERFDRKNGEKLHVQTLAAMNPEATSYEELFEVCRELGIGADEQMELYGRMVFNVMGGNVDDHSKNFSFLMGRDGVWHIAPAYDLTFSIDLDGASYENVHSMSILGKVDHITEDDLLRFARLNGVKNGARVVERVEGAICHFYRHASRAGVDDYWKDRIEERLSCLVSPLKAESMCHYRPTVVEPYRSADGFWVSDVAIVETRRHDFRVEAVVDGKRRTRLVRRGGELAEEFVRKGRNKMAVEDKKEYVERLLLPMVAKGDW